MTTTELIQVLRLEDKTELPVIAGLTPQQSLDHHSLTHPTLATATIGEATPDVANNKLIYSVTETLGTKG